MKIVDIRNMKVNDKKYVVYCSRYGLIIFVLLFFILNYICIFILKFFLLSIFVK